MAVQLSSPSLSSNLWSQSAVERSSPSWLFRYSTVKFATPSVEIPSPTQIHSRGGFCKAGNVDKACQIYAKMKGSVSTSEVDMYFETDMGNSAVKPNLVSHYIWSFSGWSMQSTSGKRCS
ncbi:unnamed protein product [Cuscuta epithymum]|uniref:Pentatricopeptide repeat-containing protein n=1 Tax=Cuscuta epithymum TaxID=186058 RepID=A0AAV0EZ11_9ASTE|nr:unnamed protein product [Cuscuta epithymum]